MVGQDAQRQLTEEQEQSILRITGFIAGKMREAILNRGGWKCNVQGPDLTVDHFGLSEADVIDSLVNSTITIEITNG